MRFPGFCGPTYRLASGRAACERTVNLYPEVIESGNGANAETKYLRKVPGLRKLATVGDGPIRGVFASRTKGKLYVASGAELYAVDSSWNPVKLGNLLTESGPCDFEDNGQQMVMVDGRYGYVVDFDDSSFDTLDADLFVGGNRIAFCDGYLISNNNGTGQFFLSALYDGSTYDALDYTTAEGLPDDLLCVVANQRQLWAFGAASVEVYYNSGDSTFTFSRIDGSLQEHGCASPWTPQKIGGGIAWLTPEGAVLLTNGFQATRISNHAVETAMREAGDLSDASAWVYQTDGHWFYCLNAPGSSTTWVYDLTTSQWHERCDYQLGTFLRHRAGSHAVAYRTHVVGDYLDGRIYALDPDVFANDDTPLVWERTAARMNNDGKTIVINAFQLDIEAGAGLDGTQQGTDPQVMLQVSRDGGNTWGPERWRAAGKLGAYRHRAIWRQLGLGRDLVVRVRGSEPTKLAILGASIEVTGAAR